MDHRGAGNEKILSSEYEVLFCVRDMLELYERQLTELYKKTPTRIEKTKCEIEKKICEIENELEDSL